MPHEFKTELGLFLTVENIFGIVSNRREVEEQLKAFIDSLTYLKKTDIIKYYDGDDASDVHCSDVKYFENLIDQVKIYLRLRPNLCENFPELLI